MQIHQLAVQYTDCYIVNGMHAVISDLTFLHKNCMNCKYKQLKNVISISNASGSREKKNGVGMALDVATLSLIMYRKVCNH